MSQDKYQSVLNFWFNESSSKDHWSKNDKFDQKIREKFLEHLEKAIKNDYDSWCDRPAGSLALIILLDQFSRNLFRNHPRSYSQDTKARLTTCEGIDRMYLDELNLQQRLFYLMPLIHSEDINDHTYVHQLGDLFLKEDPNFVSIKKSWNNHTIVIKKFGRYPHRNKILARVSNEEEIKFLTQPNSSW